MAQTLLHLYPEIGVGARRTVSRFHRAEMSGLLPWLLPSAEDLAHGVDLECVDARTIALTPHWVCEQKASKGEAPDHVVQQLLFDKDRLVERRLVEMPANKIKAREIYDGKGGVRWLDGDNKEVRKLTRQISDADAPNLRPDLSNLVVLPLPYRSRAQVMQSLGFHPESVLDDPNNGSFEYLQPEEHLQLLTAFVAEQRGEEAQLLYRRCFREHGDKRRGLFTLLAAAGVDVSREPSLRRDLEERPDDELLHYIALCGNPLYEYLQRRLPFYQPRGAGQGGSVLAHGHCSNAQAARCCSALNRPMARRCVGKPRAGEVSRARTFLHRHPRD